MIKKLLKLLFHRVVLFGAAIALQALCLLLMILDFQQYFVYFYSFCILLSMAAVLYIINGKSNPSYKIAWLVPILLFPIFGGVFYLMFGNARLSRREMNEMHGVASQLAKLHEVQNPLLEQLAKTDPVAGNQARYIERYAMSSLCTNTETEYLPLGEIKFARMLEELEKAEHFIFMEYFIIQEGEMWNPIHELLVRKAAQGIDVRVIYDDVGCLLTLPYQYDKRLEAEGIKCSVFNPFRPTLSIRMNNRDHRKICVIDGHTGFTGGINLADEYINAYAKHGHWKDTALLLRGDAVWDLTAMFLSIWCFLRKTEEDFSKYRPTTHCEQIQCAGYVQPFGDSPLDDEAVGENVYMNIITRATDYVYITTPYLIIDNEMVSALSLAAKQGVDVRILTPHIADKWYVHAVTRSYYEMLVENGVHIYEYTPGFVHAKTFVSDDQYAVVGTINLDYRSLYLHFECGAWLYKTNSVLQVRDDFLQTLEKSQEITLADCSRISWIVKLARAVLRVFAPLM